MKKGKRGRSFSRRDVERMWRGTERWVHDRRHYVNASWFPFSQQLSGGELAALSALITYCVRRGCPLAINHFALGAVIKPSFDPDLSAVRLVILLGEVKVNGKSEPLRARAIVERWFGHWKVQYEPDDLKIWVGGEEDPDVARFTHLRD